MSDSSIKKKFVRSSKRGSAKSYGKKVSAKPGVRGRRKFVRPKNSSSGKYDPSLEIETDKIKSTVKVVTVDIESVKTKKHTKVTFSTSAKYSLSTLDSKEKRNLREDIDEFINKKFKKSKINNLKKGNLKGNTVIQTEDYLLLIKQEDGEFIYILDIVSKKAQSFYSKTK